MMVVPFLQPGDRQRCLSLLLGALVVIGWVGCSSEPAPTPSDPSTEQWPSQAASVQGNDLGPLAVVDNPGGSDARGGMGPVRITDNCVTMMRENGENMVLIWHAAEVHWDEGKQEITYSSASEPEAEPITIREGDTIEVGGEALVGDEPVQRGLEWLATPHPSCGGEAWIVSTITKQ